MNILSGANFFLGSVDVSKRINQRVISIPLMNGDIQMMRRHSWLVNNGYPCRNYVEKNRVLNYLIENID